jgi:cytochrome c553
MSVLRPLTIIAILAITGLIAISAHAEADLDEGAQLAGTCRGCHGIPGYRNAYPSYRVPKLGGQHAEYMAIALNGYKNQTRSHQTMHAQAVDLSAQDIENVTAYFASLNELETGSAKANDQVARGKEKATTCAACHGENGVSQMTNWPTLAGQHESYLVQALSQYQKGERTDPVMAGQVINLSAQDIEDLAAYFAAQPGLTSIN